MMEKIGSKFWGGTVVLTIASILLGIFVAPWLFWFLVLFAPLALLGLYDVIQKKHSITRNFPILGHFRFLLEGIAPELHQYFVESDEDGRPFDRDTRSLIYRRAKSIRDTKPFGTEKDVNADGYTYLAHSITTKPVPEDPVAAMRIDIGGPDCAKPYNASIVNISAMSFGALSANAIQALNTGARLGNFAHDTGEGGFSPYHQAGGGDIIWQLGTGYFGSRNKDGSFSPELFEKNATHDQVKMIEIKMSQGAKPGHGGILPGAKVDAEIAAIRLVEEGKDCMSPTYHPAFSTPLEMMDFVKQLRELSGGKPIGFKICIGDPREFMGIVKAMIETDTYVDFIVVDGGEGGTGAAPLEFSDSMGAPLEEGLRVVQNTLVGAGLRDRIKIGASGKMVSAGAITRIMALGADWVNTARGFMMSVGCIQSQLCDTNTCPVGVATQDKKLQKALVVEDKAVRAHGFHRNTVHAVAEMITSAGMTHTSELTPKHVFRRVDEVRVKRLDEIYPPLRSGTLLDDADSEDPFFQQMWDEATSASFQPDPVEGTAAVA